MVDGSIGQIVTFAKSGELPKPDLVASSRMLRHGPSFRTFATFAKCRRRGSHFFKASWHKLINASGRMLAGDSSQLGLKIGV